jgi:hypothetical protein
VQVIDSDTSVFSPLNMICALRRNEIVAIQLDRSPGGAAEQKDNSADARTETPSNAAAIAAAPSVRAVGGLWATEGRT